MSRTRFLWLRSVSAFVTIYLGSAALSLLMLFDNFGSGVSVSHEVAYLVVGAVAVAAIAAAALWRERPLPRAGTAVAVLVSLICVAVADLLLKQYENAVVPGEAVSVSARRLYDLAPLVAGSAPLLAVAVGGKASRRQLVVVAAAVVAVGWLGAIADFAVHVPPGRLP